MDEVKPTKKKFKVLKWVASIFLVFLLLLVGAAWYINNQWKPLLSTSLKNTVIDATDSLYTVDFSDIRVNIITGGVAIDSIQLRPNLDIYKKLIAKRVAPENLIDLSVEKLVLKDVNPLKVYKYKKLDIGAIVIDAPSLSVFYTKLRGQIIRKEDNRTAYQRIKKLLTELKISSLFLADVRFKYVDYTFKDPKITIIDKVNIRLNNILINETSALDSSRIFTAKDVIAEINDYKFATPDSLYHINFKHFSVSTLKKQVVVEGIGLIPRYGEMAFSNQFEQQKERYKILFDSVAINNINFNDLLERRTINTSSINIMNGQLNVFLNRGKPKRDIDKGQNFPHLALQRVGWDIIADTVAIKNMNINYTEFNPQTNLKGTILFRELNGLIFNVTNDSVALLKNRFANAYLQTYLMGKGKLDIKIGFNLTDPLGAFTYKGSLGAMQTGVINSLTRPLAMVMTSSGKINSLDFDMRGNLKGAGGTMTLRYEDLNVVLMKKDERENFKKMGLISLFANALLLERANPSKDKPLRISKPYYSRPKDGSFFNLMWRAIFAGLKESVGITPEREAKLIKRAEGFKEAKVSRERRKLQRQKKRVLKTENKSKND